MRTKYKTIASRFFLTLVVGISGATLSCASNSDSTPPPTQGRTLIVGMLPWAAYGPLNVADVKGFWKSQGLDVRVVNYENNQRLNGALGDKAIDIALDMIGSWVGLAKEAYENPDARRYSELTILGETDWSHGGDKIILKKKYFNPDGKTLNAEMMKTIKGQKVGVYLNLPSVTYFLARFLADHQLKLSDVTPVEFSPDSIGREFIAGKYDLIVNYEPNSREVTEPKEGAPAPGLVARTSADYSGVIPEGFVVRSDVLPKIPTEDLVRFFRGWAKAVEWTEIEDNRTEYQEILRKYTYLPSRPSQDASSSTYTNNDIDEFLKNVKVHTPSEQLKINEVDTDAGPNTLQLYLNDLNQFLKENYPSKRQNTNPDSGPNEFLPQNMLKAEILRGTLSSFTTP